MPNDYCCLSIMTVNLCQLALLLRGSLSMSNLFIALAGIDHKITTPTKKPCRSFVLSLIVCVAVILIVASKMPNFTYLSLAALNERLFSFFVLSQMGASMVGISRG